ncbi:MAG: guanylate kinase [Thermodesulfovibrionales bacterium]
MRSRGNIFIISAPSGAGKTTLCKEVVKLLPNLRFSVSYTTRQPRDGEINGEDYNFIDEKRFREMIADGAFAEWAEVHGNYYGTSKEALNAIIESGQDVILDIDVQGAAQIKKNIEGGVYIFVLPPSIEELRRRLDIRGQNPPEEIQKRLKRAVEEIKEYKNYDYVIVNDIFAEALTALKSIIIAEGKRVKKIDDSWVRETFNLNVA